MNTYNSSAELSSKWRKGISHPLLNSTLIFLLSLFLLANFLGNTAQADTIYHWVDDEGVTHYSDQPHAGASEMSMPKPDIVSSPSSNKTDATTSDTDTDSTSEKSDQKKPTATPPSISIKHPKNEDNLSTGDSADLSVTLDIQPPLTKDLTVAILIDGKVVKTGDKDQYSLGWIDRGQHSLTAEIQQTDGKVVAKSASITFYIQHPNLHSAARLKVKATAQYLLAAKANLQPNVTAQYLLAATANSHSNA